MKSKGITAQVRGWGEEEEEEAAALADVEGAGMRRFVPLITALAGSQGSECGISLNNQDCRIKTRRQEQRGHTAAICVVAAVLLGGERKKRGEGRWKKNVLQPGKSLAIAWWILEGSAPSCSFPQSCQSFLGGAALPGPQGSASPPPISFSKGYPQTLSWVLCLRLGPPGNIF